MLKIAHISDLHFIKTHFSPLQFLNKRWLGNLSALSIRRFFFSEEQLFELCALFAKLGVDLVLASGDFSSTSHSAEFEKAKRFFDVLKKQNIRFLCLPGNHDHYVKESSVEKTFYRYFENEKPPYFGFSLKNDKVEVHKLYCDRPETWNFERGKTARIDDRKLVHISNIDQFTIVDSSGFSRSSKSKFQTGHSISQKWWYIGLDTALPTHLLSSAGLFSEDIEANLQSALAQIPQDAAIILVNHFPFRQNKNPRKNLKRGNALKKLLKGEKRVRFYLNGHTHFQKISDLRPNGLPITLDSGCVVHKKRGGFNLLHLEEDSCRVDLYCRNQGAWQLKESKEFDKL